MHNKALDLVPVGYYVLDEAGHVLDLSATGAEALNADIEELIGMSFSDLVARTDTWKFLRHLRTAAHSGTRESVRVEICRADGSTFLGDLYTLAETEGDEVRFHTSVITAAAELIKAKEEAEQISRLKTAFVANMSHEIRTPLTGIIGFATVLSKELPDEHREFAELIQESGRRLLEMLNSVLDLAKLESDEMSIEKRRIDLSVEARRVAELLAPIAYDKGLDIRVDAPDEEGSCQLRTDRAALNRILHNLIGNAIKFTDHGEVTVSIRPSGDYLVCEVSDTGIGIDPKFVPHLFEEFRQESFGTDRSHPGTGLGLTITKRLVELLGGEITMHSRKGEGSRFAVRLPRGIDLSANGELDDVERHDVALSLSEKASTSGPDSILLVEDNTDTQQLLVELLEAFYDVTVVSDATEAFLVATGHRFDFILMDINLGKGPDGVELLQQLRAVPEYQDTPIVALTAYALPGDRERFLDLGFSAYVSKPFDVDELIELPMQLG